MASGSQNMTTYNARTVTGSNSAASPAGALLLSGEGRADDATGDTWLFLDSAGGTSTPWGIKHDQANNKILFYGSGTNSAWTRLNTGDTYLLGKLGLGYNPETSGNSYKLYVSGTTWLNDNLYLAAGKHIYMNYNSTDYSVVHNHNNGNISLEATGAGLYISYSNTKETHMYYSNGSSRTEFFQINSNGSYALTRFGVNGQNTSYNFYVNGSSYFNGNTTHNGIDYFANGTTYYINNSAVAYLNDLRSDKVRLVDDWIGFYQNVDAGGSRYGYIQANANRMYFRKENGISSYGFDFNSHLYTTGHYYAANNGPHLYLAVSDLTNVKDAKNGLSANREQGVACYSKDFGSWMGDFAQGYTQSNGQIWSRLYLRNYKTDGTTVNNYIYLYANKDGATSYAIANQSAFRSAISAPSTTGSGASGTWGISISGNAATASKVGEAASWLYFNHSNEVNFGGTNTSADIYFGYRATDSRPKPTTFHFGTDSATIKAATVEACNGYLKSTANSNTITIGAQNSGCCHIYNSANIPFAFNRGFLMVNSGNIGDSTYPVGNIVVKSGGRVSGNGGTLYLGNSNNANWVLTQDICSHNGTGDTYWSLRITGVAHFKTAYGAVWNDYAEMRNVPKAQIDIHRIYDDKGEIERNYPYAGHCVYEIGDGTMELTNARLVKGCKIISDTFGFCIGETEDCRTPIAVTGRVLAYPYENIEEYKNHIGDCVCSGPNGTISIMTLEEIIQHPECIVGTISEIPTYAIWCCGNKDTKPINVNGRIWIYVR